MTNGEKMKELFPQGIISYSGIFIIFDINGYCQQYSPNWWNAEYKEPITENCIACKYDETEEEDGEHCKKCLAGDSQFELDKEFVDSTTKNDIRDNRVKDELNRVKNELEPTTKNDLAVDCISRIRVLEWLENATDDSIEHAIDSNLEFIPSVTPQEPRKGEWLRMSDLSEQEDDRYKCSRCGNVIHHKNKMDLCTFNSWCGRCGSDNGRHINYEVEE